MRTTFTPPSGRITGKKVNFMATCLADAVFTDAAKNAVSVLGKFVDKIEFPKDQTCCGQPAFNSGDFESARKVLRGAYDAFAANDYPIIVPSASCAAMLFHSAKIAFKDSPESERKRADDFALRVWEFCDYIVNGLGVEKIGGELSVKVALHNSCHSRGTGTPDAAQKLLLSINGLSLADFDGSEDCCGFGGTFSVVMPQLSSEMGLAKVNAIAYARPDFVVAADTSCLLHQKAIAVKNGINYQTRHVAQIFHAAMQNGGLL